MLLPLGPMPHIQSPVPKPATPPPVAPAPAVPPPSPKSRQPCCNTVPWPGIVLAIGIILAIAGILGIVGSIMFHSGHLRVAGAETTLVGLGGAAMCITSSAMMVKG